MMHKTMDNLGIRKGREPGKNMRGKTVYEE